MMLLHPNENTDPRYAVQDRTPLSHGTRIFAMLRPTKPSRLACCGRIRRVGLAAPSVQLEMGPCYEPTVCISLDVR